MPVGRGSAAVDPSARRARPSKRVAITVIQTSSSTDSSMLAPKMMFASGWAASWTTFAASETSSSERSEPPVIDSRIERAPSTEVSRSGEETALSAARTARLSPEPMPIPSSACPASRIVVRTSAKSRLIIPGRVISSEIPCTPWRRTSSATWNASIIVVVFARTVSRRSFGTTISVSTSPLSASIPSLACVLRREPSNRNGLVMMPTVSAPTSRARRAITGVAPVPVPPPAPAVTKTMSDPLSKRLILSCSSNAAL